ncbi:peptidoglycan/LPS O-acetylase OafA/YrhL [Flavobacterium sp. CG_9.1]|uniref:acyltransferase family protein n=1 Tax=Flavobacterium sp. CG_9.1 TaxID=2787728 RepID=UPI0018CAAF37|nr:acyltransferase [Flavobacterium sp. CG_9.1]MBG6062963.1 peptidoglycan/LPS O-acetylase OafA/YrhL [Flavobacterium sp. CG_9.1]
MVRYIPGLNGIRAIAVFFVIFSHRFPRGHFVHVFPLGKYGVDVFFVLSGFLISRSLFFQINNDKNIPLSNLKIIKNFFIRRSLRIFPIYYLLLFFMYMTGGIIGNQFRANIYWYVFYGANYLNYKENRWFGALAHLWSLSVEEQFYIFWPLILLLFFKNRIFSLICLLIFVGTCYPFFYSEMSSILTLACINAFGIGALLAYVEIIRPDYEVLLVKTLKIIFFPTLLLICFHNTLIIIPYFSERLAISIVAIAVIVQCRYSPKSTLVNAVLENKILNFIGIISYGIYLYHNIIPKYWVWVIQKTGTMTPASIGDFSYVEFFIQTSFIIGVSYLSWIIVEKPMLQLKEKIKYF